MTPEKALSVLSLITYKPGSRILSADTGDSVLLHLEIQVQDVRNPEETVEIMGDYHLRNDVLKKMNESEFTRWVFDSVMELERHEATEWFQVEGEPFIDPHPFRIKK